MNKIMKDSFSALRPVNIALVVFFLILHLSLPYTASAFSQTPGPYCVNIRVCVRPDRRDEFLNVILEDKKKSLETEPDCLQFVVGEDTSQENIFHLHEEYKDQAGFQAHTDTPHFAKWSAFCDSNPWGEEGPPILEFYHGTHAQSEKWDVPSEAYCLNVNLYPKESVREEFLKVIANNKKGSDQDEPLCLQYIYGESTETPNTFHFHEQYAGKDGGKEGFEAHTKAPHFAAWESFASAGEPFTKDPVVRFFRAL